MTTPSFSPITPGWPIRLACLGLALAPLSPALAVDGTITITGEIIDSTCKINGAAPPAHILVNLPKIAATSLKDKGDVAGATVFLIQLSECPTSLSGEVKAHFEPGPTTDHDSGNLYAYVNSTSAAMTKASAIPDNQASQTRTSNVEIQLANTDGTAITIGAPDSKAQGATLASQAATLRYLARYIKSGDGSVGAGKLVTYVNYSIVYP